VQVTHLFDAAFRFGPPLLWWVQSFELKHKLFKGLADCSNKRHLESWCAAKENVRQTLRYVLQHSKDNAFLDNSTKDITAHTLVQVNQKRQQRLLSTADTNIMMQRLLRTGFPPQFIVHLFSAPVHAFSIVDSFGNEISVGSWVLIKDEASVTVGCVDFLGLCSSVQRDIAFVHRLKNTGKFFASCLCVDPAVISYDTVPISQLLQCVTLAPCYDASSPRLLCVNRFVRRTLLLDT